METDPQTISAYLVYLSQHAPVEEQGQHNDLALVRGGIVWVTLGMSRAWELLYQHHEFLGACYSEHLGVSVYGLKGNLCLWFIE